MGRVQGPQNLGEVGVCGHWEGVWGRPLKVPGLLRVGGWGRPRSLLISPTPTSQGVIQGTVPYLGTFLTDLVMLDTAMKDYLYVSEPRGPGPGGSGAGVLEP